MRVLTPPLLALPLVAMALATPAEAQRPRPTPPGSPVVRTPPPVPAPASVTAHAVPGSIQVIFSAVATHLAPAVEYYVSRSDNGGPELVVFKGPPSEFTWRGMSCSPSPQPSCSYRDRWVESSTTYTYWVRAAVGETVSPPGPPVTIKAQ